MNAPWTLLLALLLLFDIAPARAQNPVAEADNHFGFKLFQTLCNDSVGQNVCMSPFSVAMALEMLDNGAGSETREEIERVLELRDHISVVNTAAEAYLKQIAADTSVTFTLANSLWSNALLQATPRAEFRGAMRRYYQANVTALPFDAAGVGRINHWISERTQGQIPELLRANPKLESTGMLLVNALYFKGRWAKVFDKKRTSPQFFRHADGSMKLMPFMQQSGTYSYLRTGDTQAVRLPYKGNRFAMYVLVPDSIDRLPALIARLSPDYWQQVLPVSGEHRGKIELPRFKSSFRRTLNTDLKALGMSRAFHPDSADFRFLLDQPGYVGSVLHQTVLEVNEEGTVAAAVTGAGLVISAPPGLPFHLMVNRPFLCAIRDEQTGVLLFLAAVYDPESGK